MINCRRAAMALLLAPLAFSVPAVAERGYVALWPNEIASFDTASNVLSHLATVPFVPRAIRVAPGGAFVYALQFDNSTPGSGNVRKINTSTGVTDVVVSTPDAGAFLLTADGSKIVLVTYQNLSLTVIDTSTWAQHAIPLPTKPFSAAFDKHEKRLFVLGDDRVMVVDLSSESVIATVPVGIEPNSVATSNAGNLLFVFHAQHAAAEVIGTTDFSVIGIIPVVGTVATIEPSDVIYASEGLASFTSVVNVATRTVLGPIIYPGSSNTGPGTPVFSVDSGRMYVSQFFDRYIAIVDPTTNSVVGSIPTTGSPIGLAFAPRAAPPDTGLVAVPALSPPTLAVLVLTCLVSGLALLRRDRREDL
ncbi:MAG TPA: YncE family protein [Casimicrobiaceae bacterium]|nr:YncE family protein [Casimicrobiaceae bacterium]